MRYRPETRNSPETEEANHVKSSYAMHGDGHFHGHVAAGYDVYGPRGPAPAAPHALVPLWGTCPILSSLHPLKEWNLQLSRGGSERENG